jgi:hypothetical protein
MKPQDMQADIADPKPKAPYQRPELKRIGTLRDVTAQTSERAPTSPPS